MTNIIATQHAQDRWNERFSYLDMTTELRNATRPTASIRKKIILRCKNAIDYNPLTNTYYLISPNDVVFVLSQNNHKIITVFQYIHELNIKPKSKSNSKSPRGQE